MIDVAKSIVCAVVVLLLTQTVGSQGIFPFRQRIMSYNVHHCQGVDERLDVKRIADIINEQHPDAVAIQELDSMARRTDYMYELGELAKYTGYHPSFAAAMPYEGGKYGIGILTREIPKSVKRIPLPGKEPRMLIVVELENYVMACTHLDLTEEGRLESLPIIFREAKQWKKPFVLAGDWNDIPTSKTMKAIAKKFNFISDIKQFTKLRKTKRACIDYIAAFKNKHKIQTLKYQVLDETVASDHLPIVADACFVK